MTDQLYLHHELMLLAIRDDIGTFSGGMFLYSVSGAMVSELLIRQKIVLNKDENPLVELVDTKPTGDEILDELLEEIKTSKKQRSLKDWVYQAANLKELKHRIAQQLCDHGILKQDEKKVLWLFTQRVYPELDGSVEDSLRARMAAIMFDPDVKPDARTAVLIALASHASLLKDNFATEELRQHQERIKQLADGDLLATGATKETIEAIQAAIMVAALIPVLTTTTISH